jgi:hypothetical protein
MRSSRSTSADARVGRAGGATAARRRTRPSPGGCRSARSRRLRRPPFALRREPCRTERATRIARVARPCPWSSRPAPAPRSLTKARLSSDAGSALQPAHSASLPNAAGTARPDAEAGRSRASGQVAGWPGCRPGPGMDHGAVLRDWAPPGRMRAPFDAACAGRRPAPGSLRRWRLDRMLGRDIRRSRGAERRRVLAGSCAAPLDRPG